MIDTSSLSIEEKGQLLEQVTEEIFEELLEGEGVAEHIEGLARVFHFQIMSKVKTLSGYAKHAYEGVEGNE